MHVLKYRYLSIQVITEISELTSIPGRGKKSCAYECLVGNNGLRLSN
jgi:hypothetical protein